MNLPRIGNAQSALNRTRLNALESLRQARNLLSPEEVSRGVSPGRVLMTTLGGQGTRPITDQDIRQFQKNVAALGDKKRRGLTAAEALAMSSAADLARARAEIRYSMPARLNNGHIIFVTDSGPNSKATRHNVSVRFVDYSATVARPGTPFQAAMSLTKDSPLLFFCDCEHWRYRLAYIASVGGWNEGTPQPNFPKLTNPSLSGVLCKHCCRVATDIQKSAGLRSRISNMVQADRAMLSKPGKTKPKVFTVTQRDAETMLPKRVRTIRVPADATRRAALVPKATQQDIALALKTYSGRADANSQAIACALQNLLAAQQTGVRP